MGILAKLMIQLQVYMNSKKRLCLDCNEIVIPRREISVINLLFYIIIGIIVYFITKNKLSFLLPILLSIINSIFVKPKCPKCKGTNFKK